MSSRKEGTASFCMENEGEKATATEVDLEAWEEWDPSTLSFVDHMLAGSFAGLAEHVTIFPLDTLKTNIQCDQCGSTSPLKTLNCAKRIVNNDKGGIFRLWRGVGAMFAGCIPAHAAYFSLFEAMKVFLGADREGHYPVRAAACGASATFVHDLMMTPFDVVKQRMQLGYHHNILDCVRTVVKLEGVRAFYLSFPTTVAMNIPYGCVMVAVNESSRKVLLDYMKPPPRQSHTQLQLLSSSLLAGFFAGGVASFLTTPLDVVKTRLQTQSLVSRALGNGTSPRCAPAVTSPVVAHARHLMSSSAPKVSCANTVADVTPLKYSSMRQTFRTILKEEGYGAMLRGAAPRMLVQAPSVAISWTAYEFAKSILVGTK